MDDSLFPTLAQNHFHVTKKNISTSPFSLNVLFFALIWVLCGGIFALTLFFGTGFPECPAVVA